MAVRNRKDMLLEAGLALSSELSLPIVLQRIVDLAVQLTDARYGALGIIDSDRRGLKQFVTTGISARERKAIGPLPQGRGVLGVLIDDALMLRLADISQHPRSVGFPAHHPPMKSFLGSPVVALGRVFGNIYLTEKRSGAEFTHDDESSLKILATQAGVAIANAWLYEEAQRRERNLDALRAISNAILAGTDPQSVLTLIASRARQLLDADASSIVSSQGDGSLVVTAADGTGARRLLGMAVPFDLSLSGEVIRTGQAIIAADASADARAYQPMVGTAHMGPAILVPLRLRGRAFGTLSVAKHVGGAAFEDGALELLEVFADQASVALEYGRAQSQLQRLAIMDDRERIARELHDGIIQSLFAVGMGLQAAASVAGSADISQRIESAVDEIDRSIRDLRNYIFGLRPGILADRHLDQALKEIVAEFAARSAVEVDVAIDPAVAADLAPRAADLVQLTREALSNVSRHASARRCWVSLKRAGARAVLSVRDDGAGFDVPSAPRGQGLNNLHARAKALGGSARVTSAPGKGTTVRVSIPTRA